MACLHHSMPMVIRNRAYPIMDGLFCRSHSPKSPFTRGTKQIHSSQVGKTLGPNMMRHLAYSCRNVSLSLVSLTSRLGSSMERVCTAHYRAHKDCPVES